ncbi:MAG: hypothetical protein EHM61_01065 [Acidobacteria bacterium]|nr:MAG: hypothetical protein EHM61_01065 [Acidobacteriota bacterium]
MFSYHAYGLGILSELALPELLVGQGPADVEICLASIDQVPQEALLNRPFLRVTRDEAILSLPVAGTFIIRGGRQIQVIPENGADERLLRRYLCGTVMGILLHQRGLLILHASVISVDGQASAFLGAQGSGKSSIATILHARGHGFLCDDVGPLKIGADAALVYPSFPQVKISLEAAGAAGVSRQALAELDRFEDKLGYRLSHNIVPEPKTLREIFVISPFGEPGVGPLKQQEAVLELVRHTFPTRLGQPGDRKHLLSCIQLARQIPLFRLPRARVVAELPEFARRLEGIVRNLRKAPAAPSWSVPTIVFQA